MSKQSGIGERLFVAQYDISGDIGALGTIQHTRALLNDTDITQNAVSRLPLHKDGHLAYTAFFDTAAGMEHAVLSGLFGADALYTWATGITVGAPTGSLQARQSTYAVARGADGSLSVSPTADADGYGLEWGNLLTSGLQSFGSAAAGTSVDYGAASTAFGLAAYLHVTALTSGTATVTVQDSADNSSFANLTGGGFTAITGPTSQRIQTGATATVRRYLRVNVTGTFSTLVAAVSVVRYLISPNS